MGKYQYNEDFFKTWSNDMAYILGFIMADGCICGKNPRLSIAINPKDIEILNFISQKICPNIHISDGSRYDKKYKKYYYSKRISICNKKIVQDLMNLDVNFRKTGHECIPKSCPIEFIPDFIRGFFDGDGCISQTKLRPSVQIGSASLKILEQIQENTKLGNIHKPSRKIGQKSFWNWQIGTWEDILKFRDIIYNGGFSLTRKMNKFNNITPPLVPRWTKNEVEVLKANIDNIKLAASKIGKNYDTVVWKVAHDDLKIRAKKPMWTKQDIEYIKFNFDPQNPNDSINKISKHLNKTFSSISHKISRLNLCNLLQGWSKEEVDRLILLKSNFSNKEISKMMGRSINSIKQKAHKLGIKNAHRNYV